MTVWSTDGRCHTAGCVAAVIATTYPGLSRDEMRREEREARRRGDDPNWTEAIGRVVGLDAESAEDLFHGRNARPLLQQVAVAVVAVPERASEEGDARLVFEVRVGEHPRPVFLAWVQSSAHQPLGHVQHGRGGVPVVSGDTLVPRLGGQLRLIEPLKLDLVHVPSGPESPLLSRLPGPVRPAAMPVPSPFASDFRRCSTVPIRLPRGARAAPVRPS